MVYIIIYIDIDVIYIYIFITITLWLQSHSQTVSGPGFWASHSESQQDLGRANLG